MFFIRHPYNLILGWTLTAIGAVILYLALGEFLLRLSIAFLGIYLIYNGLKMCNKLHKLIFLVSRYGGRFGGGGRNPFNPFNNRFGPF